MIDRLAPFLILLLNQFLVGFTFLFGLLLAGEALPRVGPWLLALAIWEIPHLLAVGRCLGSVVPAPRVFKAVLKGVQAGHLTIVTLVIGSWLLSLSVRGLSWAVVGFIAFIAANIAEGRQLRRQLHHLSMLE